MNGFENEEQIKETINSLPFENLSTDLKNVLKKLNSGIIPKIISAKKIGGKAKPDLSIKLDSNVFFISVKKGSGNSVHQEKLETFIPFVENLGASVDIINAIKLFIWSDGTINGSGEITNRKNVKEMANAYPSELKIVQCFFNTHKKPLIHRFITTGIYNYDKVTHLIYGDKNNIYGAPIENIELFLSSQVTNASLSVGKLSFQAWNVVKNGNPNTENRRGQIQLKWGGLKNDILKI
jgi:hypothetical protein